jgi:hypothetical protein
MSAETDKHATKKDLLEAVFSMRSEPILARAVERDSEPRITVMATANSNLAGRQTGNLAGCHHELVAAMRSCEITAIRQRLYHDGRRIFIVGNCYQATTRESLQDFMCSVVQRFVECVDP